MAILLVIQIMGRICIVILFEANVVAIGDQIVISFSSSFQNLIDIRDERGQICNYADC